MENAGLTIDFTTVVALFGFIVGFFGLIYDMKRKNDNRFLDIEYKLDKINNQFLDFNESYKNQPDTINKMTKDIAVMKQILKDMKD